MSSQTSHLPPTPPPGSAEFLATLLIEESNYSCAHTPKLIPGKESKIPPRLGLFHCTDEDLSYIDTDKLCLACYNAAIPDGFLCWSAFYAKKERNVFSPDEEYKSGDLDPNPISHAYEKRVPSLPPNEDTRTVWRFFEHAKMPFYIDIVHISPPWRGDMGWRAQNKEDLRVGEANAAAYLGAALVFLAVPEGGDGPYGVVEQRLGTFGTYRLLSLGPWGDDTPAEEDSDPEEVTDGKDTKPFDRTNVAEVNPTFYPYPGKSAYRGGVSSFFPDKEICDKINKEATGIVLPPTVDELLRRAYQKELPKDPTKVLLSPGQTSSDPPADIQPDSPVPRVPDVPLVRWPDAERTAYEKGQGLQGVEVGTAYPVESVAGFAVNKPRFMLKPMYKQSSHGIRSDGSLSADPYDFSVKPPDTAENELIYGTSDDEEEEQPIQQIHAAFINIDSDSDDDLSQRDNNGNTEDEESESKQGDSSDDGENEESSEEVDESEDGESSEDGDESEDGEESDDDDKTHSDRPHHSPRATPSLVA
ncbi:hypothetical protein PENSOL_c026G11223 [Penicillium solitum]|uniref:Uncharacterized protein n=1 Tax=Penicillium solitum TaxID=60172 RepID=A0A1V6QYQ4_9EURO|nr:uncharacterized protein PENSOL_c026G11223 [Penicillium solitum]OQD94314.1 hypothetical protein PENSOL_c026G11223 [Penicillium solitum]